MPRVSLFACIVVHEAQSVSVILSVMLVLTLIKFMTTISIMIMTQTWLIIRQACCTAVIIEDVRQNTTSNLGERCTQLLLVHNDGTHNTAQYIEFLRKDLCGAMCYGYDQC